MPKPASAALLPGVWTVDVFAAWLRTLGVPSDPRARLVARGPWPRGHDRVIRLAAAPGTSAGRSPGEEALHTWKGVQLAFRGPQGAEDDQHAEALALDTHQRIVRAPTGVWLPAAGGRLWLTPAGLTWPAGGPSPMGPVPDDAQRFLWTCTYLARVIEYPTPT